MWKGRYGWTERCLSLEREWEGAGTTEGAQLGLAFRRHCVGALGKRPGTASVRAENQDSSSCVSSQLLPQETDSPGG